MNWKFYKVTYYSKKMPGLFSMNWDYYKFEALSSKDALKMAREAYSKELQAGVRNLPPIKEMNFVAIRREC